MKKIKKINDPAMEEMALALAQEIAGYGEQNVAQWLRDYPVMIRREIPKNSRLRRFYHLVYLHLATDQK